LSSASGLVERRGKVGVTKDTRTCKRCRQEKDKKHFYSPTDSVCIGCNPDVNFIKLSKKIAREQGTMALRLRYEDYMRRARLTKEALESLSPSPITVTAKQK
jgi:hypothetical protein